MSADTPDESATEANPEAEGAPAPAPEGAPAPATEDRREGSAAPEKSGRWSRKRLYIVAGAAAIAIAAPLIAVPIISHQVQLQEASSAYDAALTARAAATGWYQSTEDLLTTMDRDGQLQQGRAASVLAAAPVGSLPEPARTHLTTYSDRLALYLEDTDADAQAPSSPPSADDKPSDLDPLRAATRELEGETDEILADASALGTLARAIDQAADATSWAGQAAVDGLPALADTVLAANASATNDSYIALLAEKRDAEAAEGWGDDTAQVVAEFAAAVQVMQASQAAEEAEEAGPLYGKRVAVEAFARSIAGGVRLDFNWAPVVNGFGAGDSAGGTATWYTADNGYSTISLSNSVAAYWDSPRMTSLVAHEVGHSITSKCHDLYVSSFGSQDEVWATAWAIGMGYNGDGNGVPLYGRPSDDLIALSTQCR